MNKKINQKKKGSVLVFAIIILSIITVTVLSYTRATQMQVTNSINTKNSVSAFHAAETGLEKVLFKIYKDLNSLDTINDLAISLGGNCDAVTSSIKVPSENIEFSFKKKIIDPSGKEKQVPVTNCDTVLADISSIKTVGKHNQTARAFYQKLKNSLKRGLVAHWRFEDNVDALVYNINFPGSPTAKDSSDNNHTLTLCPIDNGDHKLATGGSGNESFDYCYQYYNGNTPSPDPSILGDSTDNNDLSNAIWMDHGGAFDKTHNKMVQYRGSAWGVQGDVQGYKKTSGIVDEYRSTPLQGSLSSLKGQALYFNGKSNYLTMNTSESGRTNYVKDEEDLKFKDALSISFWFKFEGDLSDGNDAFILGKYNDSSNKGYKVYIKDSNKKICVSFDTVSKCSSSFTSNDNNWHHVVVTWDNTVDSSIDMYIDNSKQLSGTKSSSLHTDDSKFMIGGVYQRSDDSEPYLPAPPYVFPHADIKEPFKGYLDDIRLYERKLSSMEIKRLYNKKI